MLWNYSGSALGQPRAGLFIVGLFGLRRQAYIKGLALTLNGGMSMKNKLLAIALLSGTALVWFASQLTEGSYWSIIPLAMLAAVVALAGSSI